MKTITELTQEVQKKGMSPDTAAVLAMDRRDAGLCDECDTKINPRTHDFERDHLCDACREQEAE